MLSNILVTPTFNHPLELHSPEYEEVVDAENKTIKYRLVTNENVKSRWVKDYKSERSLDDAAAIAAKTVTVLLEYGMDLEADENEQAKWLEDNPVKKNAGYVNQLPDGEDPVNLFKVIHKSVRDNVFYNTDNQYKIYDGCYKEAFDDSGVPIKAPLLDVEIKFKDNGKLLTRRKTANSVSDKFGLNPSHENTTAPVPPQDIYTSAVAAKLAGLLNEYDRQIVRDAVQLRTYITNRLIEISNCGNSKDELRALELLGKISDVGLFVEKSEITVVATTSAAIEHSIKDKINRLLGQHNLEIEDAVFTPSEVVNVKE
jgi:hypothetical protein